ncbi:MAG TPA: transposase [Lacunisphaera sp.]
MARRMRMESEAGVYHVLNRGNYRSDIFRSDKTKAAFLKCLGEACERTGWQVHAWCIMSNHYHLALSTPRANLVDGMQWLQGTFAIRFNRFRQERGHLFQGRYKSLMVDPDGGLGPLCHYIHLNPVRAGICKVPDLRRYAWTSLHWLWRGGKADAWYDPRPALAHAGDLQPNRAGVCKYLEYLGWLAEDEPARQRQQFDAMSKSWVIGTVEFAKEMLLEHRELAGRGRQHAVELNLAREALWAAELKRELRRMHRTPEELLAAPKSADWKLELAAALKMRTTVTNRWLGINLNLGARDEVCRKLMARSRAKPAAEGESTYHRA